MVCVRMDTKDHLEPMLACAAEPVAGEQSDIQHVAHRVQPWPGPGGELRGPEGSVGEGSPAEGAVDHLYLLAF